MDNPKAKCLKLHGRQHKKFRNMTVFSNIYIFFRINCSFKNKKLKKTKLKEMPISKLCSKLVSLLAAAVQFIIYAETESMPTCIYEYRDYVVCPWQNDTKDKHNLGGRDDVVSGTALSYS